MPSRPRRRSAVALAAKLLLPLVEFWRVRVKPARPESIDQDAIAVCGCRGRMRTPQTDVHVYVPTRRRLRGNLSRASEHVDDSPPPPGAPTDAPSVSPRQPPGPERRLHPSTPLVSTRPSPPFGRERGNAALIV